MIMIEERVKKLKEQIKNAKTKTEELELSLQLIRLLEQLSNSTKEKN